MKNPWQKLSSKIVYQNPWIKVREDQVIQPNGKKGIYGVVEISPAVFVVAMEKDRTIYFVELYRYSLNRSCIRPLS